MPLWISIILWVVTSLPDLYKTVKWIIDMINKLPKTEQKAAKQELGMALKAYKLEEDGKTKRPKGQHGRPTFARLEKLRERLEARLRS